MKTPLKSSLGIILYSLLGTGIALADPLSYTGRLTNANGSPVTGPVDLKIDLGYTTPTGVGAAICSKTISGVALTNGVFHLKIDFSTGECGGDTITTVLVNTPAGEATAMRVTDLTHSKAYSYHALHALPFAQISNMAKTLPKLGANSGQALMWNGSQWAPGNVGQGDGTVTQINTGAGLVGGPITTTGTISIADGGVTAAKLDSMGAMVGQVLKWSGIAWVASSDTGLVAESDPTVSTFAKTAPEVCDPGETLQSRVPFPGLVCETLVVSSDSVSEGATNQFFTDQRAKDAAVADSITDAITDVAPSQNAVFDALALKQNKLTAADDLLVRSIMLKTSGSANAVGFIAPNTAASNVQWTLPNADGTAGYVLKTDGAGNLSWVSPSSGSVVSVTGLAPISTSGSGTTIVSLNYDGTTIGVNGSNDLALVPGGITNTHINNSAAIAWTKISKAGATAADVAAADVTRQIIAGTGLVGGGDLSADRTLSVNVGTGANQIVQMTGAAKLPAVDGSLLTNIDPLNFSGVVPISMGGTGQSAVTNNSVVTISSGGAYQYSTCGAGQVLSFTGAGFACITPIAASTGFAQGGNSFNANAILGTNDNFPLIFETNNTNRMFIDTNGNVGIGTTTPMFRLNVQETNGGFFFDGSPASYNRLKSYGSVATTGRDLLISAQDSGTTPDIYIQSTGNVGIGTSSPSTQLHLKSTIGSTNPVQVDIAGNGGIKLSRTGVANPGSVQLTVATLGDGSITTDRNFGVTVNNSSTPVSNALFVNNSGKVGIGTTTPVNSLNVAGGRVVVGSSDIGNTDLGYVVTGPATTGQVYGYQAGQDPTHNITFGWSAHSTASNGHAFIEAWGGNNNLMLQRNGGSVGVGTTNPAASAILDLTSSVRGFLLPRMTTAERNAISSPAIGLQIFNTSTNAINFYDGAWKAVGAVGSSITSITAGTGLTGGTITSSGTIAVDVGTGPGQIVQLDALSRLPNVDGSQLTNLNPANLSTVVPINKGGTGLAAAGAANTILGVDAAGTSLEYKGVTANSPLALTHGAGTMALDLGTVPTSKGGTGLTTSAANRIITTDGSGAFQQSMCSPGEVLSFTGVGFTCILPTTADSGFVQGGNSYNANATLGTNDAYPLIFETNNTNRMAIDTNGNVGIGTTNPSSKLHILSPTGGSANGINFTNTSMVQGTMQLFPGSSSPDSGLLIWGDGSGWKFHFGKQSDGGATKFMTIVDSGRVGIGTTNPSTKLDVELAYGETVKFGGFSFLNDWMGALRWNGNNVMTVNSGSTDANFTAKVQSASGFFTGNASFESKTVIGSSSSGAYIYGYDGIQFDNRSYYNAPTTFSFNGTEMMRIGSTGNVGIGTASPRAKLDVAGGDAFFDVNRGLWWGANTDGAFVTFRSTGNAAGESYLELGTIDDGDEPILFTISGVERMRVGQGGVNIPNTLTAGAISTTSFSASSLSATTMTTGSILFTPPPGDGYPSITSRTVPAGQGAANEKTELILFHNNDSFNSAGDDQITLRAPALSFQTYTDVSVADINNPAGYNERMYINANGLVGIGTISPSERLDVAGNVRATSFISTSDRRLKTNFKKTQGLGIVKQLNGYRFDWKETGEKEYGIIAQDVEKVMPEAVVTNPNTGMKSVKYNGLFAPLIESVKELYAEITGQKKEINELKKKNKELEERLARLERAIASEKPQTKPQVKSQKK